ncbi:gamma-glutamyltransferase [Qipengyuania sediminis]|uniref:gamma-glutamyltransferase n=1 Tax=Qipengyuania sediminis TaxID=1532023 RepID=UPI001059BF9D|nr:gamma-glutamyltransferase [Qipengyuania sediminis]
MEILRFAPIALLAGLGACTTVAEPPAPPPAAAFVGTVSAADPRAEEAGLAMLRQGGNATDAAIAVMLALTVVEPQSSGIGGGGFFVRGAADGSVTTMDGRETAPAAATPDWFLAPDGGLPSFDQSQASGLSVGVPGNIALAWKAHRQYGKLPWAALFQPAIALARDGFVVNRQLFNSATANAELAGTTPAGRAWLMGADGKPAAVGTRVVNAALAATLAEIAERGPEVFYKGARAEAIARTVAAATPRPRGMTAADISAYTAKEREPVCGSYRGYRICGMGPPSSGGIAVVQILGMLERFDLKALGPQNPTTWHLFLEAQRLAYADRELYVADADFVTVPVRGLTDRAYLSERSRPISPGGRLASVAPGRPAGAPLARADGDEPAENGTSHFAAVDASGTLVSYTSTIEAAFGSGLTANGFYLNNELTDFSRKPTGADGKLVANRVEGGKRPRSSMAPTVVWDPQGRPVLAVGAAGGPTIPVQTARAIIGFVDFGLSPREAIGLPFVMSFGEGIMLEKGTWLEGAAERLRALGHRQIVVRPAPVKAGAVGRLADGSWQSARDPRVETNVEVP